MKPLVVYSSVCTECCKSFPSVSRRHSSPHQPRLPDPSEQPRQVAPCGCACAHSAAAQCLVSIKPVSNVRRPGHQCLLAPTPQSTRAKAAGGADSHAQDHQERQQDHQSHKPRPSPHGPLRTAPLLPRPPPGERAVPRSGYLARPSSPRAPAPCLVRATAGGTRVHRQRRRGERRRQRRGEPRQRRRHLRLGRHIKDLKRHVVPPQQVCLALLVRGRGRRATTRAPVPLALAHGRRAEPPRRREAELGNEGVAVGCCRFFPPLCACRGLGCRWVQVGSGRLPSPPPAPGCAYRVCACL